ncbi:MAG: hypothetical protein DRH24_17495, partial [Deltaproteobacteria bacterium]
YHVAKIYAADEQGNWNNTLQYLNFTVWGMAEVTQGSLNPSTINVTNSTQIRCRVMDTTNNSPIYGYVVHFYNSTGELGVNTTNETGWATFTYTDYSPGQETIICNITKNESRYYEINENNHKEFTLTTRENNPPWYSNVSSDVSIAHKGDYVELRTLWHDDYQLDKALLETNASGTWENLSSLSLSGNESWANFSYQIPVSMDPGFLGWRQYGNDSFDNKNTTSIQTIEVWGWAEISEAYLTDDYIYVNESTIMMCRVVDANSSQGIFNYSVSFYNQTDFLGVNYTNATGWAQWNYTDHTNGAETITCNITDSALLMYNVTENNQGTDVLHTAMPGEDTTPPALYNNTYGLNTTEIYRGESILAYALWNETISNATIEYNSTTSTLYTYQIDPPYTDNWTNYTIQTNSSWLRGVHVVKIRAADMNDVWNNTLEYKEFEVWGRAGIDWISPAGEVDRGLINLTCNVTDLDTGQPIPGYWVQFFDSASSPQYQGSVQTDENGTARFEWNASSKGVGPRTMTCSISKWNEQYYKAIQSSDSAGITLIGKLNTTILGPENGSEYRKGDTLNLNSTTKDENGNNVSVTAKWYNSTSQIATGEDTTWQIPLGHETGPELIRINVSRQYYHPDSENVTIFIWGYSNITWISPDDGNHSQGSIIPLTCRVRDVNGSYGIQNYPVKFYYKNSTEPDYHYIGTDLTNSTGYAVYNWNTGGLPLDNYTTMCNITHNLTLYYNVTADNEANTTISLTTAAGILEVYLMLPPTIPGDGNASLNSGYRVGQNKTFIIKANVTCRNANCGNVQGTVRYNVSALPDTPINTAYDTPFFIVDSPALNPKNCSTLSVNDSCILNWTINSTGALGSLWKLDVLFNGTTAQGNNTNYTKIKITLVLILHLSNHTIDWGIRDPQTTCNAAPNHPINISLDPNSNDAYGIYIKGTNLTNGSSAIPVGNVTWGKSNSCANAKLEGHFLSYSWAEILNSTYAKAGVSQPTYYWIDIPAVPALRYHGYAYVMANATA